MSRFRPFASSHLIALAVVALGSWLLSRWTAADPTRRRTAGSLVAAALLLAGVGFIIADRAVGKPWQSVAPLQLCDVVVVLAAGALLTRKQLLFELTYFWGMSGTLAALLTPDLAEDFPHFRFCFYFAQHGLIVVAAVLLAAGYGMRPRRFAPLTALLLLNLYALLLGVVNVAWQTNFMYLRHKPGAATPLDLFGPWPWYLLACEVVALLMFGLLMVPFVRRSDHGRGAPQNPV